MAKTNLAGPQIAGRAGFSLPGHSFDTIQEGPEDIPKVEGDLSKSAILGDLLMDGVDQDWMPGVWKTRTILPELAANSWPSCRPQFVRCAILPWELPVVLSLAASSGALGGGLRPFLMHA